MDLGHKNVIGCLKTDSGQNIWKAMNSSSGAPVNMFQCPTYGGSSLGGGAWGFYGCQGQITSNSYCVTIEYPASQSYACTYVGKMMLEP